jgi:hypothetical protein
MEMEISNQREGKENEKEGNKANLFFVPMC